MTVRKLPKLTGRRCQCCACGETFNGERGFDRHRVGVHGVNRRCLSTAEMTARGWHSNAAGHWVMRGMDSAGKARLRAAQTSPAPMPLSEALAPNTCKQAGAT